MWPAEKNERKPEPYEVNTCRIITLLLPYEEPLQLRPAQPVEKERE